MNAGRWAIALLVVSLVLTSSTFRRRQMQRRLMEQVGAVNRYVDARVWLNVVVQDPNGAELVPGKPKLRVIRQHVMGGWIDTKTTPPQLKQSITLEDGRQRLPKGRDWYCSEEQERIILHGKGCPLGQLVYGSEGAGKTVSLVQWVYVRWMELLGERREIGITAPTSTRIDTVTKELFDLFKGWYSYASSSGIVTMCDGTRLRLVSTYRQSKAQGSPIQGFNWSACARDEGQDQVDVHEDIESRGRTAKGGRYLQLITATAKDDPDWRTLRDQLDAAQTVDGAPLWIRRTLYGRSSPFVPAGFWDAKRSTMSAREYARRVEAKDVGPERATYPEWSREHNLILVPELGWTDVTESELRLFGANRAMLVGHDPGRLVDVSLLLKAYVRDRDVGLYNRKLVRPFWVVRGEVNTEQSTTEHHITKLLGAVRSPPWMLNLLSPQGRINPNARQVLVRADPAGNNDNRTDKTVYTQFANAGIHIKPAAYNAEGDGHGRVPKDPGIELINTLLRAESGERRLFIERRPDGSPVAPGLVRTLETSERDGDGRAEAQKKNQYDVSHWGAALRYALWAIERPRLQSIPKEDA